MKKQFAEEEKAHFAAGGNRDQRQKDWDAGEQFRRERHRLTAQMQALDAFETTGLPAIIRPSFTMGGSGRRHRLHTGPNSYDIVLSARGSTRRRPPRSWSRNPLLGWKEYEMEVVRDRNDNCIIICSIENVDPMGVHTGIHITVAPALTLTDKEYQIMRNASIAVLREIGVETGGSNVQFAVNPQGRPAGRHRDEPACVAVVRAGIQGHRLSHRQGRGHAWLSATRWTRSANDITGGATPSVVSSRPSTTSSPRSRASPLRKFMGAASDNL